MAARCSSEVCRCLTAARLPSILFLGAIYVTYVLIGGVVFWKLEGGPVQEHLYQLMEEKERLLHLYSCVDQNGLDEIAQLVKSASRNGLSLKVNKTADNFWKFTSSAVFAATVVTTIGYGNMSPNTMVGQIFCVLFALFGIPLNVVVLNRVGKYMLAIERNLCNFIMKKTNRKTCVPVSIHTVSFVILAFLCFVVPMLLFKEYEGWTYAQAIYYCFITLSTIGFGDYVADDNPDLVYPQWYGCLLGAWIFFGLAWLALLINHSIDLLERFNAYLKQRHGRETQTSQPEEKKEDSLEKNGAATLSE
ncbi:potassium channel subfamily K member 17-like [Chanos chanos]|uniref:Potassium channel subfamily K member 17-like n=1 Tax=Chanos chanos TaxID=29144 RepID=A0A6J2WFW5_CHACN|nr:potassium channel subfamily K member 17-like [Chanos chanos]